MAEFDSRPVYLAPLLLEHLEHHYLSRADMVHDPPSLAVVPNPQFVTRSPEAGHGPRVGHTELLTLLQQPQEKPCTTTCGMAHGRCLDRRKDHETLTQWDPEVTPLAPERYFLARLTVKEYVNVDIMSIWT